MSGRRRSVQDSLSWKAPYSSQLLVCFERFAMELCGSNLYEHFVSFNPDGQRKLIVSLQRNDVCRQGASIRRADSPA